MSTPTDVACRGHGGRDAQIAHICALRAAALRGNRPAQIGGSERAKLSAGL
jgi:hypothetical protein